MKQFEIRVYGRVQGVGFRYAVRNHARSLNLKGWVENQLDGSVCIAVQGDGTACGSFIRWCENGTGYSWVERIEVAERKPGSFRDFEIRY